MEDAAPAVEATAEKKRRFVRRVPTSLIVTLLGIALTAWLFPAITQQWNDRRDARALRAALAERIVAANESFINPVEIPLNDPGTLAFSKMVGRLARAYDIDGTRIDAQLRIYFSRQFQNYWGQTHGAVLDAVELLTVAYAVGRGADRDRQALGHSAVVAGEVTRIAKLAESLGVSRPPRLNPYPRVVAEQLASTNPNVRIEAARGLVDYANACTFQLIDRLRGAHVDGFSTTRGDLLRDLIP